MTRDQKEQFAAAVENPIFKGGARLLMWVAGVLLGLIAWNGNKALDDLEHLKNQQAKYEAAQDRIQLTATNDRENAARTIDNVNDRITILSNRITDVQHDYARLGDVKAGFELRDQHLTVIDHRLDTLEGRKDR